MLVDLHLRCNILVSAIFPLVELRRPWNVIFNDLSRYSMTNQPQPNNPLHGVTLVDMLEHLVELYGWEELGMRIDIRCFNYEPSIPSSLRFLRKTAWARTKVENLYLRSMR